MHKGSILCFVLKGPWAIQWHMMVKALVSNVRIRYLGFRSHLGLFFFLCVAPACREIFVFVIILLIHFIA